MYAPATVRKLALRRPARLGGLWLPTWNRRCERTAAPLTTACSARPCRSRPGMLFWHLAAVKSLRRDHSAMQLLSKASQQHEVMHGAQRQSAIKNQK